MRIERIPVDKLNPAPYNPRKDLKPGDAKYEHIKNSIDTFGYIDPIIWNKRTGNIVGGHQRFKILKAQGATEIECVIVDYDETTEKAANAALNKAQGDWDMTKLDALLADLSPLMDMGQFGFEINLPHDLVEDDFDANKALEEIEKPVTKLGDIWTLGRHRLMCGDSTDISNVTRLMDGQKSKLLFTSPPYSDMREYNGGKDLSVESIAQFISCYEPFTALQAVNLGIQRKGGEIYPYWNAYIDTAKKVGLKLLAWNVWDKLTCGSVGQQKAMIPIRHEWIFCFGKEPVPVNPTWRKKEASIYSGGRYNKIRQADGSFRIARRGNETGAFKKME
ncbi:MAG: DNA modification methylase, partial [Clostridiaceae bacterium]|nr:DNA modification methylase [Clostridiaceae bacterium]